MSLQVPQQPVYLSDMMGNVVTAVDQALYQPGPTPPAFPHVYYMHGHPAEIVARLQQKLKIDSEKLKRFPLIMLLHDFEILRNSPTQYGTAAVNVIIAALTQPELNSEERYTKTFKPILYPIYNQLLHQLGRSTYFNNAQAMVKHTQIDRLYWGRTGLYGNQANMFNDYLDAIELRGLELTIKNQHCKPFKQ